MKPPLNYMMKNTGALADNYANILGYRNSHSGLVLAGTYTYTSSNVNNSYASSYTAGVFDAVNVMESTNLDVGAFHYYDTPSVSAYTQIAYYRFTGLTSPESIGTLTAATLAVYNQASYAAIPQGIRCFMIKQLSPGVPSAYTILTDPSSNGLLTTAANTLAASPSVGMKTFNVLTQVQETIAAVGATMTAMCFALHVLDTSPADSLHGWSTYPNNGGDSAKVAALTLTF